GAPAKPGRPSNSKYSDMLVEGRRLLSEWEDLLQRRPTFRETLEPVSRIFRAWAESTSDQPAPLRFSAETCRARWSEGEPLLAGAPPRILPDSLDVLLDPALEILAGFEEDPREFAEAWDGGEIGPSG